MAASASSSGPRMSRIFESPANKSPVLMPGEAFNTDAAFAAVAAVAGGPAGGRVRATAAANAGAGAGTGTGAGASAAARANAI